jgi:hypothetical protein
MVASYWCAICCRTLILLTVPCTNIVSKHVLSFSISVVVGCIGIQEGSHIHKSELIQTLLGSSPNFLAKLNACSSM